MIKKNSFVKIIDALRDYWDGVNEVYDTLRIQTDNGLLVDSFDAIMDAICEDVEDNIDDEIGPLVYYYAFACDWGRNEKAEEGLPTFGEERVPLTSAEELYDYIMLNNAMYNYKPHTTHGGTWIDEEE